MGVKPPSSTLRVGGAPVVDLTDSQWKSAPDQPVPYVRWMQLIRDPKYGRKGLREDAHDLLKSREFKEAPAGAGYWQGGQQAQRIKRLFQEHYDRAKAEMMREYPKVRAAMRAAGQSYSQVMQTGNGPSSLDKLKQLVKERSKKH